jgi:hypothetical protein
LTNDGYANVRLKHSSRCTFFLALFAHWSLACLPGPRSFFFLQPLCARCRCCCALLSLELVHLSALSRLLGCLFSPLTWPMHSTTFTRAAPAAFRPSASVPQQARANPSIGRSGAAPFPTSSLGLRPHGQEQQHQALQWWWWGEWQWERC